MQQACCREGRRCQASTLQSSTQLHDPQTSACPHSPPLARSLPGVLPLKKGAHTLLSAGWLPGAACCASGWLPIPCSLGQSLKGRETGHSVKLGPLFSPSPLHSTLHKHSPSVSSLGLRCENSCQHCSQSTVTHSDRWPHPHP